MFKKYLSWTSEFGVYVNGPGQPAHVVEKIKSFG